jgi:hypothetical protein
MLREAERFAGANTPTPGRRRTAIGMAQRSRSIESAVADIGAVPKVVDRSAKTVADSTCTGSWSPISAPTPGSVRSPPITSAIERLQPCILDGGHFHWRVPAHGGRSVRHVLVDTNYGKSFVHARPAVATGDPGCLSLFSPDAVAGDHRLLAEHLTAEYRVRTSGRGREVDEWKLQAQGRDNHKSSR